MNKKSGLAIVFIILGILIALYFLTLGWYIIGGAGCGLIWVGVSYFNSMKVEIINSEISDSNNIKVIKFLLQNISNKAGSVNIYVNILKEQKIIASLVSNSLYLNAHSQGIAIIDISNLDNDKKTINYTITRIECKKNSI